MKRRGDDILLVVVTLVAFYPVIFNDFVGWDDPATIWLNPRLNPPTIQSLQFYWSSAEAGLYVPLTQTVWLALACIARSVDARGSVNMDPWAFHLASVVLHVLATLVVRRILLRLHFPALAACLGAAIFALHPLQVESVAWASGLKDVLAGLLSAVVVWQYLVSRDATTGQTQRRHYVIALLAMLLAMLAKPSAMVTPVILIVIERVVNRRTWQQIVASVWPFAVLVVPLVVVARLAQNASAVPYVPLWQRPLIAGDALAFYFVKLVAPIPLSMDYGRTPAVAMSSPTIGIAWLLPLGVLIGAWTARRRQPVILASVLIFLGCFAPVLGITAFQNQVHSTVTDHYAYLPLLGIALLMACAAQKSRAIVAAFIVVLCLFAVLTNLQSRTWRDSVTLFSRAVQLNPRIAALHSNLGNALAGAGNVSEGRSHFQTALQLDAGDPTARTSLAQAELQLGNLEEALLQARLAAQNPRPGENIARDHLIAGLALVQLGRSEEAVTAFEAALAIEPDNRFARSQLDRAQQMKPK